MTKRKTKHIPEFLSLAWGPKNGNVPVSLRKVIHVTKEMMANDTVDIDMALIEQIYEIQGPASVARLLAWRLRNPSPPRAVLNMVARWLDPEGDDCFKLVVVRQRVGKSPTKRINDITLKKAVVDYERALGSKHGSRTKAVKKVAKVFEVSKATVLKALRSK
jgi:hypothetical protein